MDLKELLGDLYTPEIAAKVGDKKLVVDDGKMIPKHVFDEDKKKLKDQITAMTGDLERLKTSANAGEQLKSEIEQLQAKNAEAERTAVKSQKAFAVKEALMNAGATDPEARSLLIAKFDLEKIELNETGGVKGFDELIKPIKENKVLAPLFGTVSTQAPGHHEGGAPGGEVKNPFKKGEHFNLTKQIEIKKTNPALAAQLEAQAR